MNRWGISGIISRAEDRLKGGEFIELTFMEKEWYRVQNQKVQRE